MESINLTNTLAGLAAIQRAMAGEDILFTKLEIGDGVLTNTDISGMTGLINKTKEYVLGAVKAEDSEVVRLRSNISNAGVTQDLIIREYGIYAKFDNEQEFLFAYLNVGDLTTPLPNERIGRYELNRDFILYIGNSLHVDFTSNGNLIYVAVSEYKDDMKGKANVVKNMSELKLNKKCKSGDIVKVLENGLVFEIKESSNVGFEDELHIRLENGLYANINLDASDFSYIIKKQNELVSKYLDINARGLDLKITMQGDSITYGHDESSADKVPPPTTVLPDGSYHTNNRSPRPINVSLQENLREVYARDNIMVDNRGFSGDWAERSYTRWRTPNGSNLTLFLLGQNDQGGSWVPESSRTYTEFYKWNLMLAVREIMRGACVVFADGYKIKSLRSSKVRQVFLEMTKKISETLGTGFLETSTMLYGCDDTFFSDSVHLNTKGNDRMGARLTAFFLERQMVDPVVINNGDFLGVNNDFAQLIAPKAAESSSGSRGICYGDNYKDLELVSIIGNEKVFYSFYLDEDVTMVKVNGTTSCKITLDFNTPQYKTTFHDKNGLTLTSNVVYKSQDILFMQGGDKKGDYIQIHGRGWHTIKIERGDSNPVYLNGINFNNINSQFIKKLDYDISLTPEQSNLTKITKDQIKDFLVDNMNLFWNYDKVVGIFNKQLNYEVTTWDRRRNRNSAIDVKVSSNSHNAPYDIYKFKVNETDENQFDFLKKVTSSFYGFFTDIYINSSIVDATLFSNWFKDNFERIKEYGTGIQGQIIGSWSGNFEMNAFGYSVGQVVTFKAKAHSFTIGEELFSYKILDSEGNLDFQYSASSFVKPVVALQLDTPYYATKMQDRGIYGKYVIYRDKLHEFEKNQMSNGDSTTLEIQIPPEMPEEIKEIVKEFGLM